MTIEKGNFEEIDNEDLLALVDVGAPEGLRLEFKAGPYGRTDADKRELLKDVTAMANSQGGHIILGISEQEGTANSLDGFDIDCDAEILRMEQILRNAVEPTIPGVRIRQIQIEENLKAVIIRIPRSWNLPHRVTAQGINRFYIRHSAGVHEPSIEELRTMFNQSKDAIDSAQIFHNSRIEKILSGEGHKPLIGEGKLIFHIVPAGADSGLISIDLEDVHQRNHSFRPYAAQGMNMGFNFLGYRTERGGEQCHGYTQIFRNGSLEATIASIVRERDEVSTIPGQGIERYFFAELDRYINGLRDLGVPAPLILQLSLVGVRGAVYRTHNNPWGDEEIPIMEDRLSLPICVIEDFGETVDYHRTIRPAFDALWNINNFSRSQFFDENGLWVGPH